MTVVTALLLAAYVAVGAGLAALYVTEPSWSVWLTIFTLLIGAVAISHLAGASSLLLRSATVELDPRGPRVADVEGRLERFAALAELPTPKLAIARTKDANAFTVGVRKRRAVVAVTSGLLDQLQPEELDAVLAHELAHIANRDAALMTLASLPRALGETLVGKNSEYAFYLWFFLWPLGLLPLVFGTLLTLTLSRYREFAADRGSALITGRPETMMSALVKLDGADVPSGDLRAVGALCIIGAHVRRPGLLLDHPPLEQRLAKLAELERHLGQPAR
jgi:heat shock protein HtpX